MEPSLYILFNRHVAVAICARIFGALVANIGVAEKEHCLASLQLSGHFHRQEVKMGDHEWIVTQTLSTAVAINPICALRKKVRNPDGSWSHPPSQTYEYVTHVFCKECAGMILAS